MKADRRSHNVLAGIAVGVLLLCFAAPSESAVVTFTSSASYYAAIAAEGVAPDIQTFEALAAGTTLPDGTTIGNVTYTFNTPGLDGIVTNFFGEVSGVQSLAVDRLPLGLGSEDFLFPTEGVTVAFGTPVNAAGIFFNILQSAAFDDYVVLQTALASVSSGGLVYDTSTSFFVGLISDTPFGSATFLGTANSPSGFNLDDLSTATFAVSQPGAILLFLAGLGSLWAAGSLPWIRRTESSSKTSSAG